MKLGNGNRFLTDRKNPPETRPLSHAVTDFQMVFDFCRHLRFQIQFEEFKFGRVCYPARKLKSCVPPDKTMLTVLFGIATLEGHRDKPRALKFR